MRYVFYRIAVVEVFSRHFQQPRHCCEYLSYAYFGAHRCCHIYASVGAPSRASLDVLVDYVSKWCKLRSVSAVWVWQHQGLVVVAQER